MDSQAPVTPSGTEDVRIQDVGTSTRPKGPNAPTIVLGLVALVLGALIIAKETMNLHIDWSGLGPGAIVAIGFVLVVIGAIGLVRRHDDA
jgi:multisubunit Na+/H+ antiporter MnhG subunit